MRVPWALCSRVTAVALLLALIRPLITPSTALDRSFAIAGRVVDAEGRQPLSGVVLELSVGSGGEGVEILGSHLVDGSVENGESLGAVSDSLGMFEIPGLAEGSWRLKLSHYGYFERELIVAVPIDDSALVVRMKPRPVIMDEMVVRGRSDPGGDFAAAFVEVIPVGDASGGISLAEILDRATGVNIKRYGGLGSFSTVSIRGSTAEQVLVFLDGVPLNHAIGGAVDFGRLPVNGVEAVEVYRGAIPARYGGNSIGGVVHIRTAAGSGAPSNQLQATFGSFGSAMITASTTRQIRSMQFFGLFDYGRSRNDFRFLDDNGTEYTATDDAWIKRRNSDFRSVRALGNMRTDWGKVHVRLRNAFDLKYQGVPGLGNFQALHTRFDGWRNITEVELFGSADLRAPGGYRLVGYHAFQRDAYRDPQGEVGTGVQEDRNDSRAFGLRTEFNLLLRKALVSSFAAVRRETFTPSDLLQTESELLASRRRSGTVGVESEVSFADRRIRLVAGGQAELIDDNLAPGYHGEVRTQFEAPNQESNRTGLVGGRLGGQVLLVESLRFKWHRGRYERAPSFFELFGDRGAVVGNRDLKTERADNWDIGLVYAVESAEPGRRLHAEVSAFRKDVDDLIRFVQNSQFISRPQNIGEGRIQGIETRLSATPRRGVNVDGRYAYQKAENRSPLPHERGNDLPGSPRHTVHLNVDLAVRSSSVRYELSREGAQFLDSANLRVVPARFVHSTSAKRHIWSGGEMKVEVRNFTNDQVVDLWGHPLPGRSLFITLTQQTRGL